MNKKQFYKFLKDNFKQDVSYIDETDDYLMAMLDDNKKTIAITIRGDKIEFKNLGKKYKKTELDSFKKDFINKYSQFNKNIKEEITITTGDVAKIDTPMKLRKNKKNIEKDLLRRLNKFLGGKTEETK